jgi:hypothetical protein
LDQLPLKNSMTIMHVAAERASLLIVKWLCSNGYHAMVETYDDRGLSPVVRRKKRRWSVDI